MKNNKMQRPLLGLTVSAALLATIAHAAPVDAPARLKQGGARSSAAAQEEMVTRFIVKPRQGHEKLRRALQGADASALARAANANLRVLRAMSGGAHVVTLEQPVRLSEAKGIAARLMRDPGVEIATPDRRMHIATTTPNDPGYASQWHYFAPDGVTNKGGANLPPAWDITKGEAAITVAVIDTGHRSHTDLDLVLTGYDFVSDAAIARDGGGRDSSPTDEGTYGTAAECGTSVDMSSSWHGTHLAGTIAALMDNSNFGTGIAPGVKILPVRVLGKCGFGNMSDVIDGMRWAAGLNVPGATTNANPAHVLNMSLGTDGACEGVMQEAVTEILNAGKTIVAASGNSASTVVINPANCSGVIGVTGHAIDGDNAVYSDIGPTVAISAPGGGCGAYNYFNASCSPVNNARVYSLSNAGTTTFGADSFALYQGTSMATAHVAGVAALMQSKASTLTPAVTLTPAQMKSYLQSSARAHPTGTTCTLSAYTGMCGIGLLDAAGALNKVVDLAPSVTLTSAYQIVAPNASVSLSGVNSTVAPGSGRTMTGYQWQQQSGDLVGAMAGANTHTATFSAPTTGIYSFKLTVTDSANKTGSAMATVRVNSAPVLGAVAAKSVTAGSAIEFDVTATDADGDPISFHQVAVPSTDANLHPITGRFTWPNAGPVGTYTLTYNASDDVSTSAQGSVTVTVTEKSGGGGSLNQSALLGLALLAIGSRLRRTKPRAA